MSAPQAGLTGAESIALVAVVLLAVFVAMVALQVASEWRSVGQLIDNAPYDEPEAVAGVYVPPIACEVFDQDCLVCELETLAHDEANESS